jgi:flavin reductase (DIM6/NTAB) family NADH-FMN oxidoreductase RutF/acyl carrier protein
MVSSILPRPIAWVSSVDGEGRTNLAPFSYFTGVCCRPMTVLFCPVVGSSERPKKDTLLNIEQVPEFVVNVAQERTITAVNQTAAPFAASESEFDHAGLTPTPSTRVRPPRVAEAAIAFECEVREIIEVSDQPGGGWVVLGTVLCVHVEDAMVDPDALKVDRDGLAPIARLGGSDYLRSSDVFSLKRPTAVPETGEPAVLRELREELLAWVRANAQAGAADVGPETRLYGEGAVLDSVALVSLLLLVEERLDCPLEPEALLEGGGPVTIGSVLATCARLPSVAGAAS